MKTLWGIIFLTLVISLVLLTMLPAAAFAVANPAGWEQTQKAKEYRDAGKFKEAVI